MKNVIASLTLTLVLAQATIRAQTTIHVYLTHTDSVNPIFLKTPVFNFFEKEPAISFQKMTTAHFKKVVTITSPQLAYIGNGTQWFRVYLENKKDIAVYIDNPTTLKPFQFSGSLATENRVLNWLGFTTYPIPNKNQKQLISLPLPYVQKLLDEKRHQLRLLDSLQQTMVLNKSFYDLLEGEIRYKPALEILSVLLYNQYRASKSAMYEAIKTAYDNESINNDRFLASDIYFTAVSTTITLPIAKCGSDTTCENHLVYQTHHVKSIPEYVVNLRQYGQLYDEVSFATYFLKGKTLEKTLAMWITVFKNDHTYTRQAVSTFNQLFPKSQYKYRVNKML